MTLPPELPPLGVSKEEPTDEGSRFTEEQIIGILKEHQAGRSATCAASISDATFYKWRSKYGGLEVSDAKRLKGLEEENRQLKKLPAG